MTEFIIPQRYAAYLPALAELEKDCLWNEKIFLYRMRRLLEPDLDKKEIDKLEKWVQHLYRCGETIQDWKDIKESAWLDWKWEKSDKTLSPRAVQERVLDSLDELEDTQSDVISRYLKKEY